MMIPAMRPSWAGLLCLALLAAGCRGDDPQIAFLSERGGSREIRLLTRGGEDRALASGGGDLYPVASSPDGAHLLAIRVETAPAGSVEQLMILPLAGGSSRAIGPRSSHARNAWWSPDGSWVVFESDTLSFRDLYRVDTDGRNLRRLTDNREGNFEPTISPDGRWIAFVSSRDGDAELYVMPAGGGPARRLTAFHRDDWHPRWSPNGRWIAFVSNREGEDRIFLVNADGTGVRRLTSTREGAGELEGAPTWSPDGSRIAYLSQKRGEPSRIVIRELRAGRTHQVPGEGEPIWSADGRWLVFTSTHEGDPELYRVRANGGELTRLTHSPGADWLPRWIFGPASLFRR
jgi:Tol biopolymer transport system component